MKSSIKEPLTEKMRASCKLMAKELKIDIIFYLSCAFRQSSAAKPAAGSDEVLHARVLVKLSADFSQSFAQPRGTREV